VPGQNPFYDDIAAGMSSLIRGKIWPPHEESNLDFRFRRPVFYPLNYGEAKA
jgi:hypothetical protein